VEMLIEWLGAGCFGPADLLFRTRSGRRPAASNWGRCRQRSLAAAGLPRLRIYDCRHAAATTWAACRLVRLRDGSGTASRLSWPFTLAHLTETKSSATDESKLCWPSRPSRDPDALRPPR